MLKKKTKFKFSIYFKFIEFNDCLIKSVHVSLKEGEWKKWRSWNGER